MGAWGDASYFGDPQEAVMARDAHPTVAKWTDFLEKRLPGAENLVKSAVERWLRRTRDSLRQESGLRMTWRDKRHIVPVHVTPGMPLKLVEALEGPDPRLLDLVANRRIISWTSSGLDWLLNKQSVFEELAPDSVLPIDFAAISRSRDDVHKLSKWLESIKFPGEELIVSPDILGAYWFRRGYVTIHWLPIGMVSELYSLPLDGIVAVVLFHEMAHAWHHMGFDIDGRTWDTESLALSDTNVVEGVAQFYSEILVNLHRMSHPAVFAAWEGLLSRQTGPYRKHEQWSGISRVREVIRAALLATRMQQGLGVSEDQFDTAIERHEAEIAQTSDYELPYR